MPSMPNFTVTGFVTVAPSAGSMKKTLAPAGDGVRIYVPRQDREYSGGIYV